VPPAPVGVHHATAFVGGHTMQHNFCDAIFTHHALPLWVATQCSTTFAMLFLPIMHCLCGWPHNAAQLLRCYFYPSCTAHDGASWMHVGLPKGQHVLTRTHARTHAPPYCTCGIFTYSTGAIRLVECKGEPCKAVHSQLLSLSLLESACVRAMW
jgi:hypothetical protein